MFWNKETLKEINYNQWDCSNFITWIDQRCDEIFLNSLPK